MIFLATLLLMTSFAMNASEAACLADTRVSDSEAACLAETHVSDSEAACLTDAQENPYVIIHIINHTVRPILVSIDGLSPEEEKNVLLQSVHGGLEELTLVAQPEEESVKEYVGSAGPIRVFIRTICCDAGSVKITN